MKETFGLIVKAVVIFCILWIAIVFTANSYIRANQANNTAELNTRLIHAVCKRFSNDEYIDLETTYNLKTAMRNKVAQHVLDIAYAKKKKQIRNQCPQAMAKAEEQFKY